MRLQFKARGHNFHIELIPVHSPLLRESYLVSYPPLTYMLKFSGFANLTSCRRSWPPKTATKPKRAQDAATTHAANIGHTEMLSKLAVVA